MKERPILFSTPMVKAILEGRKTVTRRVIKESWNGCLTHGGPHPCPNDPLVFYPGDEFDHPDPEVREKITIDVPEVRAFFHCSTLDRSEAKCPFGKPGDILWVRETWTDEINGKENHYPFFKADFPMTWDDDGQTHTLLVTDLKWKPSIFMPKHICRLQLLIKSISVERLNDISKEDAIREGIEPTIRLENDFVKGDQYYKHYTNKKIDGADPVSSFRSLWESINGKESWDSNPWLWRIEFEKL
jgi:hypothetical protein